MRIITSILFLISTVWLPVRGSSSVADSLEKALIQYKTADTLRVNLLNEIANEIRGVDGEKSLVYATNALDLAQTLSYKKGEAEALKTIGTHYYYKSSYPQAIDYFQQSMHLFEQLGDSLRAARCLNNVGMIFYQLENNQEALKYHEKALSIRLSINDKSGMASSLNNIGIVYFELDNYDKAQEYYIRSLEIQEGLGSKKGVSSSVSNIGLVCFKNKEYNKALEYFERSLRLMKEINNKSGIVINYANIADVYRETNNSSKAILYYGKSLDGALTLGALNDQRYAYLRLSEIHAELGNYRSAYENQALYIKVNDSIFNEKNIEDITALTYQYKHEKEVQAIELQQQKKDAVRAEEEERQKLLRNSLLIGLVLLLLLVVFVFRNFLQKRKANKILAEQKEKVDEANQTKDKFFSIISHDLRGPFSVIVGLSDLLLERYQRYDEVKRLQIISNLNQSSKSAYRLLDNLFTWARSQSDSVKFSPENLELKDVVGEVFEDVASFAKRKEIALVNKVPDDVVVFGDKNMVKTFLRNLVANSLKFTHKQGAVEVSAFSASNNHNTKIVVSDTGVGMNENQISNLFRIEKHTATSGTDNELGTGLGLIICKEFVDKHNGEIEIKSVVEEGTEVIITLPKLQENI